MPYGPYGILTTFQERKRLTQHWTGSVRGAVIALREMARRGARGRRPAVAEGWDIARKRWAEETAVSRFTPRTALTFA